MDSRILCLAVLLPVVWGVIMLIIKPKTEKVRRIITFSGVLITSLLALSCIIFRATEEVVFLDLTSHINLSFKLDGLGMVFAGLISIMWPFATLYAFEYMAHYKKNKNMFFAFYLMTFGVTLGISFSANSLTMSS